jgi:hypothetical protein
MCVTTASPAAPHVAAAQQPGCFVRYRHSFIRRVNPIDSATGIFPPASKTTGSRRVPAASPGRTACACEAAQMWRSFTGSGDSSAAHRQYAGIARQASGHGQSAQLMRG